MQKAPFVFPIIGGRKVEHLLENIEALELSLTEEQMKYLENVVEFQPGFPNLMIVRLTLFNFYYCRLSVLAIGRRNGNKPLIQASRSH